MAATSYTAIFDYSVPLANGEMELRMDLHPALGSQHKLQSDFESCFALTEWGTDPVFRTVQTETSLEMFLSFFGDNWTDALQRWSTLAFEVEWRKEHGPDTYIGVWDWEQFYDLLARNIKPVRITLSIFEHA